MFVVICKIVRSGPGRICLGWSGVGAIKFIIFGPVWVGAKDNRHYGVGVPKNLPYRTRPHMFHLHFWSYIC